MGKKKPFETQIVERGLRRDAPNDISYWQYLHLEAKGTRVKSILKRNSNDKAVYLFKQPNEDLEISAEVFNSILATEVGLPHVQYFPAIYKGLEGVVCKKFIDEQNVEELWEMKELLYRHSLKLQKLTKAEFAELKGRDPLAVDEQNIDNIYLALDEEFGETVHPEFFQMIGFDALIGHTDRHWENYGVIVFVKDNGKVVMRFAPVYDTVSAFYLQDTYSDRQLETMLKGDLKSRDWYCFSSPKASKIKVPGDKKSNHFDLMKYILCSDTMKKYKPQLAISFDRFTPKKAAAILDRLFTHLTPTRKRVIIEVLSQRHRIGKEILDSYGF